MSRESRRTLDRRRFLYLSSAGLMASTLADAALAEMWDPVGHDLVLGYCGEVSGDVDPFADLSARSEGMVLPDSLRRADRLATGETGLRRSGARLVVEGLRGDPEQLAEEGIRHAALLVRFPGAPGGRRFTAWSYAAEPACSVGGSCEFDVPVDVEGLEISLEIGSERPHGNGADGTWCLSGRLVTGSGPGPKLRSGTYAIPLRQPHAMASWWSPRVSLRDEPALVVSVRPAGSSYPA